MIGILMIIGLALLIDWFDTSSNKKATKYAEQKQKEFYAKVDAMGLDEVEAREYKARADVIIAKEMREKGHDYEPKNIKQVTSEKERTDRENFERDGILYISEDIARASMKKAVYDKNFEFFVNQQIKLGKTRDEAERIVKWEFDMYDINRG